MRTHPERIDQYELQVCLARDGLEVWKAFDTQARRTVAVKLLRGKLQAAPDLGAVIFLRTLRVLASLRHPNIVPCYDFSISHLPGAASATPYWVTEYRDGETLAGHHRTTSRQERFLSVPEIVRLVSAIGLAVEYGHQQGVPHGDLKPTKILLDQRNTSRLTIGEPLVTDFGITRLLGQLTGNTGVAGNLVVGVGTPPYCAPERVAGAAATARSDTYSLGIMLYQLCTGALPFGGSTPAEIIRQQMQTVPPPPSLLNPTLPAALSAIILRCLAKDPAARFQSASALVAALADVLREP